MKDERKILNASSYRDGIIFMSSVFDNLVVKSYFDSNTNTIETITKRYPDLAVEQLVSEDLDEPISPKEEQKRKLVLKIGWGFNIILIGCSALIAKKINYTFAAIYYSVAVSNWLYAYIYQSFKIKVLNGKEKERARYHSAEHMILNAYQKLERVPSLKELKTFSRFSAECGSRIAISKFIECIPISLVLAFADKIHFILYILVIIISIGMGQKMRKRDFIKVEQILVTEPPTDLELEVARKGLEKLIQEEEKMKEATNGMKN